MNLMGLYEPYRVSQRHLAVGGECHPTPRGYRIQAQPKIGCEEL